MKKLKAKTKSKSNHKITDLRVSQQAGPVETVEEYLARGGTITICEPGVRSTEMQTGQWTRNRRRVKPPTPVDGVDPVTRNRRNTVAS
tara:strand:+ start:37 stop:300 length:264 start_codon:yes stop_codon:yes gene_type:complete